MSYIINSYEHIGFKLYKISANMLKNKPKHENPIILNI